MNWTLLEHLESLQQQGQPYVLVTVVDVLGSVPPALGIKMIVTQDGLLSGTVGGGKLEQKALQNSLDMLSEAPTGKPHQLLTWHLQQDVGMTCGGSVTLFFEKWSAQPWRIVIFGAGHVCQALVPLLLTLDCHLTCIDSREDWLHRLPKSPKLLKVHQPHPQDFVPQVPPDSFVALMTMGHATDLPILLKLLAREPFPYLGVIGSKAKAARLHQDMAEAGLDSERTPDFYCPIGLPLGSNHPSEIAVSIAAQLLQTRDEWLAAKNASKS